ncbi:hypothetical protein DFH28DRAFT_1216196 [Melampsora americana]|nr:hypothetical protein DFH28DRAFT_1216196 [Melampsora americana]
MFRTISFQSLALCFLFSVFLLGLPDKTKVLGLHIVEDEASFMKFPTSDRSFTSGSSCRQIPSGKVTQQSKGSKIDSQAPSSLRRIPSIKKFACKASDLVENVMAPRGYSKMKSVKSSSAISEQFEIPVFTRAQSAREGTKMGRTSTTSLPYSLSSRTALSEDHKMGRQIMSKKADLVPQKHSLWANLKGLVKPPKTSDWSSQVLEKAPRGAEVVEKYIATFDPEAFTRYLAGQEKKAKHSQMSNLKKLTAASNKTTPTQFINMIQSLEPVLQMQSMRNVDGLDVRDFLGRPKRYIEGLIDDGDISSISKTEPGISNEMKEKTEQILLNVLKEHLRHFQDFSKPEKNGWMFYRSLKDQLSYKEGKKGKDTYDLSLLQEVVSKIFQKASERGVSDMTDNQVLKRIVNENINLILSARLERSIRDQNLTEEDALYIRQCLGSVHTFTLKDKRSLVKPFPYVITTYYSTICQRYSDFPELRYLARRLHEAYNSRLHASYKHEIYDVDIKS